VAVVEREYLRTRPIELGVPRGASVPAARMPHLAGLDGLRALAVAGVVLYHLDLPWMPGGFLGVDVFFVLSGFLITTLVVEEVERTGRLSYRQFYLRRARRLLPALWLLLASVSVSALLFFREEIVELRGDVLAALLYVSNWWYIAADVSYFEFTGRPPVLQHLWSLAVEEQFYLVWPVIVVAAMATGRRRVRRVALVLAVVSTLAMAVLSIRYGYPVPNDPSRVYFGSDTHAMGLLLGAALATAWSPWRRYDPATSWARRSFVGRRYRVLLTDLLGVAALVGVVWFFLTVGEFSAFLYRGGFLVLSAVTAALIAALAHPAGLLGRAMAVQPLRYLGERSYGIYLWHWPVFMVTRPGFELGVDGWPAHLLRVGLTLGIAELSYRYVETPIRHGAIGRLMSRARSRTPDGRQAATRLVAGVLALALVAWAIGLAMVRVDPPADRSTASVTVGAGESSASTGQAEAAPAARPDVRTGDEMRAAGSVVRPPPAPPPGPTDSDTAAEAESQVEDTPEPAPEPPAEPKPEPAPGGVDPGQVSAFGDSVIFGPVDYLRDRGAAVTAGEALSYPAVFDEVRAAQANGSLRRTVVLHTGNNGAIADGDLRGLLDELGDHDVALVTLHVPRSWERYNNDLFARAAADYPNVRLLDWNSVAAANPAWLYDDRIHLVAPDGRQAYTNWLLRSLTS
jgi:peptidoglycan/LPS O-acetylase OafA/YrhL